MRPGRRHCLGKKKRIITPLTCLAYWASLFPHPHHYEKEWRWLALAPSIHQPPPAPPTFADGPIKNERHLLLKKLGAKPLEKNSHTEPQGNS